MQKTLAIFLCLLFFQTENFSQNRQVIEKLWQEYRAVDTDTARVRRLWALSNRHYAYFDVDSATILWREMSLISEKINFEEGIVGKYLIGGFLENRKLNLEKSIALTDTALSLARKLGSDRLIAASLGNLGGSYQKKGDFENALRYLTEAKEFAQKSGNLNTLWSVTTNIGVCYGNMLLPSEAMKYASEALEIAQKQKNTAFQIENIYALFHASSELHDLQNMKKWATLLDSMSRITNNAQHFYFAHNAKANVAMVCQDYENAKNELEKALEFAQKIKNPNWVATAKAQITDANLYLGNMDLAGKNLQENFANAERSTPIASRKVIFLGQQALLDLKKRNWAAAEKSIARMESFADSTGSFLDLRPTYFTIAQFFISEKNDFENAYKFYMKGAALQDSIFNAQRIREAAGIELRYVFEKERAEKDRNLLVLKNEKLAADLRIREQQSEIFRGKSEAEKREILLKLLEEEQARQTLTLENQSCTLEQQELLTRAQADSLRLLNVENELLNKDRQLQAAAIFRQKIGWGLTLAGAGLLAFFGYQFYRRRQRKQLENLRFAIARDLHDEIGSSIGSIALFGKSLQKMLGDQRPDASEGLSRITQNAETSLESLRDIVWTIDAGQDSAEDFVVRAREFVLPACSAAGVECDFRTDVPDPDFRLHPNLKKNLWLFLKEAVANALRYSETDKLEVVLAFQKKEIRISVRDFGIGFDPQQVRSGSKGLKNLAQRAADVGGKFELKSEIGGGTRVGLIV